jgi:hypothetical protein
MRASRNGEHVADLNEFPSRGLVGGPPKAIENLLRNFVTSRDERWDDTKRIRPLLRRLINCEHLNPLIVIRTNKLIQTIDESTGQNVVEIQYPTATLYSDEWERRKPLLKIKSCRDRRQLTLITDEEGSITGSQRLAPI